MTAGRLGMVSVVASVGFGIAFAAGTLLVQMLAGPWRRAGEAHWTERARLGFAPGVAVLLLALAVPWAIVLLGEAFVANVTDGGTLGAPEFCAVGGLAFLGGLWARGRWLREFWGPRVTLRSYASGWCVMLFLILPHFTISLAALAVLPEKFDWRAGVVLGAAALLLTGWERFGIGLGILRVLGAAKPAPAWLTEMVMAVAQKMGLPYRGRVWELNWPMANAVACQASQDVGFSNTLLQSMTPDEVRSVAAHELAHLTEDRWVIGVRTAHALAYLPVVALLRYGGLAGLPLVWVLLIVVMVGYKRFTHRFEERADRIQSETTADRNAYMLAMIALHRTNMSPAVYPGKQTHPHLYDRLLAGGIQPDFPRPAAPSNAKPMLAALGMFMGVVVFLFVLVIIFAAVLKVAQRATLTGQ